MRMNWADGKIRCCWANPKNERYIRYHDEEWGVPVHDDRKLFEMLILECFQAGLSWECVLNKRDAFREAFDGFDVEKVCVYKEEKLEALPSDASEEMRAAAQSEVDQARQNLAEAELQNTVGGRLGMALEPLTSPAGFNWRTNVGLVSGIAAKEALVSTLGTAYSLGEVDPEDAGSLAETLASQPDWSRANALSLMLFVLLYSPCFVALVVIKNEAGGWRWLVFSLVFNTLLAYGVAVVAYHVGLSVWG